METQFEKQLTALINEHSLENDSDTPDFILARYLKTCLENFNAAVREREEWYGRQPRLSKEIELGAPFDEELYRDTTGHPPPQFPSSTNLNNLEDLPE